MKKLTERQRDIVNFIIKYKEANQNSPTMREIAKHFNFSSKAAFDHLCLIEKKGYIKRKKRISRGIIL